MKFYAKSKKRVPEEVQKQRLMEALEPVSYTHLDVYKRQGI